jgi:hypothetical protein
MKQLFLKKALQFEVWKKRINHVKSFEVQSLRNVKLTISMSNKHNSHIYTTKITTSMVDLRCSKIHPKLPPAQWTLIETTNKET